MTAPRRPLGTSVSHRALDALEGRIDFGVPVRRRDEAGLEGRRREVHAAVEHRVEKAAELLHIARARVGERANGLGTEEKTKHGAGAVSREWNADTSRDLAQTRDESCGAGL